MENVPKFSRITPVLRELHWLPVNFRIKYKIALLTYKALNNLSPLYIRDMIAIKEKTRTLRSNNKHLLKHPNIGKNLYNCRSFTFAAPQIWNELPEDVKLSGSLGVFRRKLKTHLFREAFC